MDSESDSNQSQEMFSDDEPVTEDCQFESPKIDVSFVNCSQSSTSHGFSTQKEFFGSPEIPKTPLSLGPFISKAEVWTSDLETPEQKKPGQNPYLSSGKKDNSANYRMINGRPRTIYTTPPRIRDNPIVDEIIPTSQTSSADKDKKRRSRRIMVHVSNDSENISKFDQRLETQDILGIIEEAQPDVDSENKDECRHENEYKFHGEMLDKPSVHINQLNISNPTTLENRVRQLRELQEQRMKRKTHEYISDEVFSKSLKSLVSVQNVFGDHKTEPEKSSFRSQLGFIPFSQIPQDLDVKNSNGKDENTDNSEEGNLRGFTKECQNESERNFRKFYNFLCQMDVQTPTEPPKSHDDFMGFSTLECDQSHSIAKKNEMLYKNYLDNNRRFFKKPTVNSAGSEYTIDGFLPPLSLSVDTGFRTASGDEILVNLEIIYRSKSSFLDMESSLTEHSIDELLEHTDVRPIDRSERKESPQHTTKNQEHLHNNHDHVQREEPERTAIVSSFTNAYAAGEILNSHQNDNIVDGFRTARGTCLQISEQALKRANAIFSEEKDIDLGKRMKSDVSVKSELIMKEINTLHTIPARPDEFQGADKTKIISHDTVSKAYSLFENEKDLCVNEFKVNPSVMGFQTGHGKSINISKSALMKAKNVFAEDIEENLIINETSISFHGKENLNKFSNMGQLSIANKRKHAVDDDTPVGRKKLRTGPDLQGRKLFSEIEDEDNYLAESDLLHNRENCMNTDRSINFSPLQDERFTNNTSSITNHSKVNNISEVEESVAALLKDEENSNGSSDEWSNKFVTDFKLLKNRWSEKLSWQKSDKTLAKRSRSCPGVCDKMQNELGIAVVNKTSVNAKLPAKPPPTKTEDIPEDILFDSPFSEDFIDPLIMEKNRRNRLAAIARQQTLIESKKRHREHQVIKGSHLRLKEEDEKVSLQDLFKDGLPNARTPEQLYNAGIDPRVLSINSESAIDYQFRCVDFFGQTFMNNHYDGIQLADGAILIPNDDNLAGVKEFKECFLASPGVDVHLVPNGYIENHYRWIVWKLAALDRLKLDDYVPIKFLTPDRVMRQLKYRYDREIDRSQRPALRRILEKDDAPTRRLVLCVSRIFTPVNDDRVPSYKSNHPALELTDGWYSVRATIDYAMIDHMKKGKIHVGTKLMIYGAELLNLDEGRYPLDITDDVRLKIHTNSTRRVRWYTKLGYQRQSGPMQCKLKSINPNGGLIGKVTVAVARIYPIIYREKIGDGQFIDRNARCEEKVSIAFEADCQSRIEAMCADTRGYRGGKWKAQMENRVMNSLPVRRDVTPITKIKIADGLCSGLITLWSGAEESQSLFKENSLVTIRNALASGKKMYELQITANRYTNFEITNASAPTNCITCPTRTFTSLDETYRPEFNPYYGEFDTIGVVASVGPAPHGMKNFETVNLAFKHDDSEQSPSFYLSILFWQGISSYGFAEIATVGSFIACSNLEWRKNTYKSIPTAFCTERTVLTRNPKQNHLCQPFEDLRARIMDTHAYVEICAVEIQNEILKKSRSSLGSCNTTPCSENRNNSPYSTPRQYDTNSESLVTPNDTPRNDARSIAIKSRIDKLRNYGDPPSLSPIHLAQTPKIASDYRSPINRPSLVFKPHTK